MDIHIDLDQVKFFVALVIAGSWYGHHLYKKGLRTGWDDCAYTLGEAGLIDITDDGEITRLSDREFSKRQIELDCEE